MNKIIESANEAVAKCAHDLIRQPDLTPDTTLDRFYCLKCKATFYEPRPPWRTR